MLCRWADDSQRFILEYFDTISNSPSEIYHCALPLSPSSSWLLKCYGLELSQKVKVIKGLQARWGTCSRTVSLDHLSRALVCWKDLVAVGLYSGDIIILDVITGICTSVLSSQTKPVVSLAFSLNGIFLVSGGLDNTTILWDMQTGGVIKTFLGHTGWVQSVSISLDCTIIASGSSDHTIRLWNVHTGECCCVIDGHNDSVCSVGFSPTNSQLLISASWDGTVRQWNTHGHQIGSTHEGNHVIFSSDGTCFVSWKWRRRVATVWDSNSGGVVAELEVPNSGFQCCCFSPDGKFVAGGVNHTIYIWDITGSIPCLVKILSGHIYSIASLAFSSSLISSSNDKSVKFWQTSASPVDLASTDSESTPLPSTKIRSVSLQATSGIAISSDDAGVVKTWDTLTGLCKASFQIPTEYHIYSDAWLIEGRLTFVWLERKDQKIHVWDLEKGEALRTLDVQFTDKPIDFRISGDGSQVFLLYWKSVQALSIWTGQVVGEVMFEGEPLDDSLVVDGSRVWVCFEDLKTQGWDFGLSGSVPVPLSSSPLDTPHLWFIGTKKQCISPSMIIDIVTGKVVFQLPGRYATPCVARLDGQYLVAGYRSGEVLILDLNYILPQ